MTTLELILYYANLLIIQYIGKERAYATIESTAAAITMPQTSVQTIAFSVAPTSGAFELSYDGVNLGTINWNDSSATIQTLLQLDDTLSEITVTGSIAGLLLTVTLTGVPAPADAFALVSNSLGVDIEIDEIDEILPLAVQNGFNLIGNNTAVGAQLDIIGKYVGASRSGYGFFTNITLDDSDYLQLIRMAIVINGLGSSLYDIQSLLQQFFPAQILVFDHKDMTMSYAISTSVGSENLVQLFITEGFLPKPTGVRLSAVIYVPTIENIFGFRTYETAAVSSTPFNTYSDYNDTWHWLSYKDAINV